MKLLYLLILCIGLSACDLLPGSDEAEDEKSYTLSCECSSVVVGPGGGRLPLGEVTVEFKDDADADLETLAKENSDKALEVCKEQYPDKEETVRTEDCKIENGDEDEE